MTNILHTIPVFNKEKLAYKKSDNDEISIKINKYEHLSKFKINKQTLYILSLCNGSNTLIDIVNDLKKKYSDVDEQTIKNDLLMVLEQLWTFEVISWKTGHPFTSGYKFKKDEYSVEALSTENIGQILEYMDKNYLDDPHYDVKYMRRVSNMKDLMLLGLNSYYIIKKGEDVKLVYKIMNYSKPSKNSLLFHPVYVKNCDELSLQFLLESIKWSKTRQETLLKRKMNNKIYCNLEENLETKFRKDYLENIGFNKIGEITKEQTSGSTRFDVLVLEV